MSRPPDISFVVVVDVWETARRVVESLAKQAAASRIEVVLVAPDADALAVPPVLQERLAGVTVVEHPMLPLAAARARGVHAAAAEVVVLGETHVFPEAAWAERVLAAHADGWSAVTPAILNANPPGALAATALHLDYGRFASSRGRGVGTALPRTNASIARSDLLALGGRLELALGPLGELPLPPRGVLHEPSARIAHQNVDRPLAWVHERFLCGRLVGGARAVAFSRGRRLAYGLAAPAVAAVLFARAIRLLEMRARAPRMLAALALAAVVQAAGETCGYLFGGLEHAERRMLAYEIFKWRFVRESAP